MKSLNHFQTSTASPFLWSVVVFSWLILALSFRVFSNLILFMIHTIASASMKHREQHGETNTKHITKPPVAPFTNMV